VIDHGPGIDPDLAPHVFDRFWRADDSRSRDRGGAGLGLAIVAAVVGAHDGHCEVLETAGGGATFRVDLPLG
jgi:two-component system OmpR family sensor kinase